MNLLNIADVAKILRCSKPLVYKMVSRGQLPHVRWDETNQGQKKGVIRFKLDDILAFIDEHYNSGTPH